MFPSECQKYATSGPLFLCQSLLIRVQQRDVEAQTQDARMSSVQDTSTTKYATSGRGGAGNVTDKADLAASTRSTIDTTPDLQETNPASDGHWGRGGAGNYRASVSEQGKPEKREMEDWKRDDVEMGVKAPEPAHLSSEKPLTSTLE